MSTTVTTPTIPAAITAMAIEPDRKLATIVKISNIEQIPNATSIEYVSFYDIGWQVVVKKDENLKIGDLAIYFSIGSVLEKDNKNTAFLEGKQLKTRRMLGYLSQGLLGPLTWLVDYGVTDLSTLTEGMDVTEIMRVKKYIYAEEVSQYNNVTKEGSNRERIPPYVPKTDEMRIQDGTKVIRTILNSNVVITRKEDGTSTTFIFSKNQFKVYGRNFLLNSDDKNDAHYFAVCKKFNLEESMTKLGLNIAIQGETVGPKIGKNKINLKDWDFRVFNIWNIDNQYYMEYDKVSAICNDLKLNTVPLLYRGNFRSIILDLYFNTCAPQIGYGAVFSRCSNNFSIFADNFQIAENTQSKYGLHYLEINKKYNIGTILAKTNLNIALCGQIVGHSVSNEYEFHLQTIYDIDLKEWLLHDKAIEIAKLFGFNTNYLCDEADIMKKILPLELKLLIAPIQNEPEAIPDINREISKNVQGMLLAFADSLYYPKKNPSDNDDDNPAEGIVVKTDYGLEAARHSFKVISNKFLLKHKI
jgi:RNA ligase (TIGR02306 family)